MKKFYLTAISLLILLCSCNETFELPSPPSPFQSQIISRNTGNASLPEGSTALFNITGDFHLSNCILTYTNNTWSNEEPIQWPVSINKIYLTAIHPALDEYSSSTLYTDNKLTDVLIAQDTLTTGNKLEITFKHLFSALTVRLNETIRKELLEISLTIPQTVSSLQPSNGKYTLEAQSLTVCEPHQEDNEYQFILPPMDNAVLNIVLRMKNGEIYSHLLEPYTFLSGYNYVCNIIKEDQRPGIKTAADLIAFSLLINKQSYTGGKTLADFGEEKDGKMTYRLLEDITLTDDDCKELLPIGYYDSRAFQDTFDGEGHCIYHLTIPDKSTYSKVNLTYSGLFGHIGTNGRVQNLRLSQAQTVKNATCTRTGFFAALNEGIIMNCHIEQSTAHEGIHEKTGFICGQLSTKGHIINCSSSNNVITSDKSSYVGGLVGYGYGYILNCYTDKNKYNLNASSRGAGEVIGYSPSNYDLTIANCYTHNPLSQSSVYALTISAKNATIDHFFYNQGTLYNTNNSSNVTKHNVYKYDASFQANGTPVTTWMNNWIKNEGTETYPNFTFKSWILKDGEITFN